MFGVVEEVKGEVRGWADSLGGMFPWADSLGGMFSWTGKAEGELDILDSQFERGEGALFSSDPWSRW